MAGHFNRHLTKQKSNLSINKLQSELNIKIMNFHELPDNTEKPIKTIDAKFFLLAMFIILVLAFICSHFLD